MPLTLPAMALSRSGTSARKSATVGLRVQDNDCERYRGHPVLERETAVDRDERVKMRAGQAQQFTILDFRPAHLARGPDLMTHDVPEQSPIDALVEQDLNAGNLTNS